VDCISMLAPETVVALIEECLAMMGDLAPALRVSADEEASGEIQARYEAFLTNLATKREHDQRLVDEAWNWIWKPAGKVGGSTGRTAVQLYGRLAFINHELFHLL
jgi:hypothetical protein